MLGCIFYSVGNDGGVVVDGGVEGTGSVNGDSGDDHVDGVSSRGGDGVGHGG